MVVYEDVPVDGNLLMVCCSACNVWRIAPSQALCDEYSHEDAVFECHMFPGRACSDPLQPGEVVDEGE